jgi:hypothetical protein
MEKAASTEGVIASVIAEIVFNIERRGGTVKVFDELNLLTINDDLKLAVCAACAKNDGPARQNTRTGQRWAVRWHIRKLKYRKTDLVLVIRMDAANKGVQDYYWFPTVHLALSKDQQLRLTARTFPEKYRHDNLDSFYQSYARSMSKGDRPGAVSIGGAQLKRPKRKSSRH